MTAHQSQRDPSGRRPYRILHINSARTWRGGEQQTFWLCRGLKRRGHSTFLACQPGSPLLSRARAAGIDTCPVKMRGEWDLWAVRRLAGLIRRHDIEAVHLHTAHAHTLGLLAAQMAAIPFRFVTRRVDFHTHRHVLNRWKYGSAVTAVVAISEGIRRVLLSDGIPGERIITVPSGIDLERIEMVPDPAGLRSPLGIPEGSLVVGMVAALAPHKDHRTFLQAAAMVTSSLPDVRFLIIGDGPLRPELERLAGSTGLSPNVIFTGFREDALTLTKLLDIFVLSSYLEGLGTALLDAMAMGKPLVATNVGGIPEALLDGRNGLLVPPRDPRALAAAIVKLGQDPGLRDQMGDFGKKHAQKFDIVGTIDGVEEIYRRFLQGDVGAKGRAGQGRSPARSPKRTPKRA
jgi:glycosyltransferase involved in cell wall biosynthesis